MRAGSDSPPPQSNGRPNWDYFDLQHPVTPTALPMQEFMKHYENLYHVFSDNYFKSDSPLTVQAYQEHAKMLRDPLVAVAAKVLTQRRVQSKAG